jgi:hypothetical protein
MVLISLPSMRLQLWRYTNEYLQAFLAGERQELLNYLTSDGRDPIFWLSQLFWRRLRGCCTVRSRKNESLVPEVVTSGRKPEAFHSCLL